MANESWWLKFKRAQYHMVEIRNELVRYRESHPYQTVLVRQPKSQRGIWLYKLRITMQPNPMLAAIVGEFLYDLRSALDHVVVACVPRNRRKHASFPIALADPWEKDVSGKYIITDDKVRESFDSAIKGIDPRARALIIKTQPYHLGDRRHVSILGMLSRLENADKHRDLVVVDVGLRNFNTVVRARGKVMLQRPPDPPLREGTAPFMEDGAEVAKFSYNIPPPLTESEVNVHVSGSPVILLKVSDIIGNRPSFNSPLPSILTRALSEARFLLEILERFITT